MADGQAVRVGLIADTHLPALIRQLDELGPEISAFLSTVDLILHGGDVTAPSVLDWLAQFAPVIAADGNNDDFRDPRLAPVQYLEIAGWRIGMVHDLTPETRPLAEIHRKRFNRPLDIMIAGHTHLERIRTNGRQLLVNSGSPILPHHRETRLGTVGLLELRPESVDVHILRLGETPGRRNPGKEHALQFRRQTESSAPAREARS